MYLGEEPVGGCYERDTFARNICDEGFRVTGPTTRACSRIFEDNVLIVVIWIPNDPVSCERKFMISLLLQSNLTCSIATWNCSVYKGCHCA